jgi:MFS family permease
MSSSTFRGVAVCIAATTTVTITLGLTWPFLAIVLAKQGVPAWLNGLSASAQMMAVLLVAPLAPRLIGWLGTMRVMGLGIAGMAIALMLLTVFPNVWAWFPIRFCLGLAAELVFTGGDLWINQLASDKTRGRLIGVYGMFLHGGFALGPAAIVVLGSEGWSVLYLGVVVILLGLVPLYWARGLAPPIEGKPRARLLHFLRIAPTLMVAGLMFGLIDSSTLALLPVYGIEKGLGEETAALLLTMFVLGAVVGQVPVGWLADHVERHRLMAWCGFVTLVTIGLIPISIGSLVMTWAVMLVMGMSLGGFYVIAMAMIGQRFQGADLVGINASFVFLWGVGTVVGPLISGSAIETFGPDGMPGVGVALCAIFVGFVIWRIRASREAETDT